jgi:hypothetical protein
MEQSPQVSFMHAKRLLMAGTTAFLAINLWTGAPLLALWVGSQVVGKRALSMAAVFTVVIVLAVLALAIVFALAWLDAAYKRLTGHPLRENRLTWLRSMNTQGETVGQGIPITLLEGIIMATVYIAVVSLLVWFFVFARSPLPT